MRFLNHLKALLVSAIMATLLSMASCNDNKTKTIPPPPYGPMPIYLTETEARDLIMNSFTAEGVTFTQDYAYQHVTSTPPVEFDADGYNAAEKIGFEYSTVLDRADSNPATNLTTDEEVVLGDLYANDQDYIRVFKYTDYEGGSASSKAEAQNLLQTDVDAFIADLKSKGVL